MLNFDITKNLNIQTTLGAKKRIIGRRGIFVPTTLNFKVLIQVGEASISSYKKHRYSSNEKLLDLFPKNFWGKAQAFQF